MSQGAHHVRLATANDRDAVFSMAESLAATFVLDPDSFSESFDSLRSDQGVRLLIAEGETGVTLGYLLGFEYRTFFANGSVGWIEEMYVIDRARRSGVGAELERSFETWVRDRGASLIALATRRAAPFCSAIGFEVSAAYFRKLL